MARTQIPVVAMATMCALLAMTGVSADGGGRPCTGSPNEIFRDPGPHCDRRCDALLARCFKVYVLPPSGCYCRDGFARDSRQRCIPIEEC